MSKKTIMGYPNSNHIQEFVRGRMTKKQRQRENLAKLHERIAGGKSEYAQQYRATNRRVDKRKGRTR